MWPPVTVIGPTSASPSALIVTAAMLMQPPSIVTGPSPAGSTVKSGVDTVIGPVYVPVCSARLIARLRLRQRRRQRPVARIYVDADERPGGCGRSEQL